MAQRSGEGEELDGIVHTANQEIGVPGGVARREGLGSIVEISQAELQKTEADIADTDAACQYRLTEIVLAYTISAPK
jgi:hypothetical protein